MTVHCYLMGTQSRLLTTLKKKSFENIVRKGENAGGQHFLLFPQSFLSHLRQKSSFKLHLFCRLQFFVFDDIRNFVVWQRVTGTSTTITDDTV